jgi:hypothetical protein
MIEFLKNFLNGIKIMLVVALFLGGLFVPMILAVTISGWFAVGYFITIPLCCSCLNCFIQ